MVLLGGVFPVWMRGACREEALQTPLRRVLVQRALQPQARSLTGTLLLVSAQLSLGLWSMVAVSVKLQ